MCVYVVDDDPRICRLLARLVGLEGFEVHTFEKAAMFLENLTRLKFGHVILDIDMPEHNGLDVLDHILHQKPYWPVIIISGSTAMDDAITAFRRGAIHFLRKPFRRDDLRAVLSEARKVGVKRIAAYELQARVMQVKLTGRETQVLDAMAGGLQSKMIAWKLGLSIRTVDMHRSNILAKLSARNSSQAVAIARGLGLTQ